MFKHYSHACEMSPLIEYQHYSDRKLLKLNSTINTWVVICDHVCRLLPFEAKCIHQSFFLYKIVRKKYGIPASLVIGTCPFPFSAHAWIMLGDENFFEEEYETSKYNVLLRSEAVYEMGSVEH